MPDLSEVITEKQEGTFVRFPDSPFELFQPYPPAGDQPEAIDKLVDTKMFRPAATNLPITAPSSAMP